MLIIYRHVSDSSSTYTCHSLSNSTLSHGFPAVYCLPHLQHQSDLSDHLANPVSYLWLREKSASIQPFNHVRWVKHVEFANGPHAIPKEHEQLWIGTCTCLHNIKHLSCLLIASVQLASTWRDLAFAIVSAGDHLSERTSKSIEPRLH